MSEIKENLRKMGWDDNLIEHFVDKNFTEIKTSPTTYLKQNYVELHSVVYEENKPCNTNSFIYSSK